MLGFNFLGDGLRDRVDPKLVKQRLPYRRLSRKGACGDIAGVTFNRPGDRRPGGFAVAGVGLRAGKPDEQHRVSSTTRIERSLGYHVTAAFASCARIDRFPMRSAMAMPRRASRSSPVRVRGSRGAPEAQSRGDRSAPPRRRGRRTHSDPRAHVVVASWSIRLASFVVGCEEQRPPEQRVSASPLSRRCRPPFQSFERLAERDAVAMSLRGLQPDPAEGDVDDKRRPGSVRRPAAASELRDRSCRLGNTRARV